MKHVKERKKKTAGKQGTKYKAILLLLKTQCERVKNKVKMFNAGPDEFQYRMALV